ncbi:hypothetical protein B0H11DRAFT_2280953, partial [Mycena galericulata]
MERLLADLVAVTETRKRARSPSPAHDIRAVRARLDNGPASIPTCGEVGMVHAHSLLTHALPRMIPHPAAAPVATAPPAGIVPHIFPSLCDPSLRTSPTLPPPHPPTMSLVPPTPSISNQ